MADRGGGWWPEEEREESPGTGRDAGSGAGEQERGERTRPPRGLESSDRPRARSRYSLYVGIAFAAIAIIAIVNAMRTDEGGIIGADSAGDRGWPLAEFAAPDVLAGLPADTDANIAQDDCEGGRNPCPPEQLRPPACEVEIEGAIRVCDFFDRPLAISFWFTRGGDCIPTQNAFARVAQRRSDELNFLSVNILDDRDEVASLVRENGWDLPVAHDTDGAVSNVYGVGVCPTLLLAYPGGILHSAEIKPGNLNDREIDAAIDDLMRASAARERRAR
jgi:hypothetical protein